MPYHVHISKFEGPLALLLHLIESAELDIRDIFVSEITTQYLEYLGDLDSMDMEVASEFITMAATLLYIKSRHLLPRPLIDELDEEDPEVLLIRQLREYKLFKQASEALSVLREASSGVFTRLPEDIFLPQKEINLTCASIKELFEAYFTLMHVKQSSHVPLKLHQVQQDLFTVRAQIAYIRKLLQETDELSFNDIFGPHTSKLEIVVTFMALLEMISRGEIRLKQPSPFAPIRFKARVLGDGFSDDGDYMDETQVEGR